MTTDPPVDGPAAPPRLNGDLVFDAPWESRAFGIVMSLVEEGAFAYEHFQSHLVDSLAGSTTTGADFSYYAHWLDALQRSLADVPSSPSLAAIDSLVAVLGDRPDGHDHDHDHDDHDHGHDHGAPHP